MSKIEFDTLYDYSQSKHISFSGRVTAAEVDVTMHLPEIDKGWRVYSERASESEDYIYLFLFNEPTMKPIEIYIHHNGYITGYDLDPQRSFKGFARDNDIVLRGSDFPDEYKYSIA